ncbi:integrin alpha-D isoform X2 [Amphiprion ocellaris]|uniref:VWFA domain-containing protein n=1 Tax=Amphiprion ocellaris TaxID=80972 RepID=A0A3Q1CQ82_AMPOC|nr:integrin alpha-D isoform X2 [Amphiprion ocellaris]
MQRRIYLLTYMVAAAATIPVALTFNIDTTDPEVHPGEQKDFFGYKVLQFISGGNKGIIVTAPLRLNGSGGIFKHDLYETDKWFSPDEHSLSNEIEVKHLGLSMAADSTGSQFTVCSPSVAHECYENSYLNSICYNINDQFEQKSFMPNFQDCTKKTVDLVFLFDGSKSMTEDEFKQNKVFIKDIMDSLKNTSIKFAAVQFSTNCTKVFDFNDYEAGSADDKLQKERHLKGLTNTYRALTFVLDELFENPKAGASPDAIKVMVLITDGDPSDFDRSGIIRRYDKKNIIRFVIGVKEAKLDKFRAIASEPKDKNAFKIENYDGLTGVLENFQIKIFNMEGTKVALAGNMTNEMAQSGFSAAFYEDSLILGSVGSNSWSGSLQEIQQNKDTSRQIEDPEMQMDSYMGYSVSVGKRNSVPLYFSGAPRFEHTGRVILFKNQGKNWTTAQRIDGDQIGSYFGAELCSADVDSDGNTDFLLVGAPLFFQPQEKKEGRIYIYSLTDKMELESKLNVMAPSMGRFGTTISILADLNGDRLRDVAVGAPLEDDNRGVVYLYLGDRHKGVRKDFSQRIMGARIDPGMRFFGQAIDGDIDLGQDKLPDIVVGSQGAAFVLRSKPVFNVMADLSFQPKEISTEKFDCLGSDENLLMVTLTACFQREEATKRGAAAESSQMNISYTISVDPRRPISRGFFSETDKKARNLTTTFELEDKQLCFNHSIYMQKCVKDTLSPVSIKLEFSQDDSESAAAVLNVDSNNQSDVEIPFEKHCRKNDTCIAELEVDFSFMTPTLLVAEDNYFNMSVKLVNHGDDSYDTRLTMNYPPGLSFSWMTLIEATRPTLHSCSGLGDALDTTICDISLPVYRSRSSATFKISFRIMNDNDWNDTISMTAAATSDNTNSTSPISMTKNIPVQHEIKMALTVSENTINYLNFTTEDDAPKKLRTIYRIDNTGFKDFPVNVSLAFPTKLKHGFEMKNYRVFVEQNKTECTSSTGFKSEHCPPEHKCIAIACDTFILEKNSAVEFQLLGDVQFKDLKQQAENIAFLKKYTGESAEVKFTSFLRVDYDKKRYVLDSDKQDTKDKSHETSFSDPTRTSSTVRVEFTILPNQLLIILTGAGLGFLLLIIITVIMFKMGCFKRKMHQYCQELEEEVALQAGAANGSTPGPTNGISSKPEPDDQSDQSPEDKKLLEANDQEEETVSDSSSLQK